MIYHQIQSGKAEFTEGTTGVRFDMPNGEVMYVKFTGTADPRVLAAYALLLGNLPMLMDQPHAYKVIVGNECNVEFVG